MNINLFIPICIIIILMILSIWKPRYFIYFGMSDEEIEEGGFLVVIYGFGGGWAILLMWLGLAFMKYY